MALGFPTPHDSIRTAIKNAIQKAITNAKEILIFAAAANWSGRDRVAFPAKMGDVFCVFSTDAGNKNSRSLNPPPGKGYNFAILGEAVKVQSGDSAPRIISGTSISTAIAAGLAGSFIDFSRQPVCRGHIVNIQTMDGINAVFENLSKDFQDQGYDCIAPWSLLTGLRADAAHLFLREKRQDIRLEILNHLSNILKNV